MAEKYIISVQNVTRPQAPVILPTVDVRDLLRREFAYNNIEIIEADEVEDKSALGTAIFMPLEFDPVTYTDHNGGKVSLKGMKIPCAICEFTLQKNIVKTAIASSRFKGTVKEHVGMGDWQVDIKGFLFSNDDKYPEDQVKLLKQYLQCPKEIGVSHRIFTMLDIYYVVIEQASLPNKQGFQNMQPFTISALSDEAVELKLNSRQAAKQS